MLLRHSFHLEEEAACIEGAVSSVLEGGTRTADLAGKGKAAVSTARMGNEVREGVRAQTGAIRSSAGR